MKWLELYIDTARAGLEGVPILDHSKGVGNLESSFGDAQLQRVFGWLQDAGGNAGRVADPVYLYHKIHPALGDRDAGERPV